MLLCVINKHGNSPSLNLKDNKSNGIYMISVNMMKVYFCARQNTPSWDTISIYVNKVKKKKYFIAVMNSTTVTF